MDRTPEVRRAGVEDVDALVRLRHLMFLSMDSGGPVDAQDTSWHPAARVALLDQMKRSDLAAFVVDGRGPDRHRQPVASAVVRITVGLPAPGAPRGWTGSMSSVFVEPAHRGRGLARAVVTAGLNWLDERGAEVVDLHATPDAEALYRSLGFAESRSLALRRVRRA